MGMPSEFWSRSRITRYFGKITTFLPAPKENEITRGLKAGEITDDTHMTIIVSKSIIESGGRVDPQAIIKNIVKWISDDQNKNFNIIGPSTKSAFEKIRNGASMEEAGKYGVTNGGAMKMIPIGIISNWRDMDNLVENVRLVCLPTHNTNLAIAGASAIAAAVSYCAGGGDDLEEMIQVAISGVQHGMRFGFEIIGASIIKRIELAIELVKTGKHIEEIMNDIYEVIGCGLDTTESVPAALAMVLLAGGVPEKCARLCANLGGDTDTIGAMACGICGAFKGIDAISEDSINLIQTTNQIDFTEIAEQLCLIRMQTMI
ncbi:MAG TPA: ADP-ribosylglycohydrolase family protein [Firmicutes bacterium]|nr:ADP-ribosylglycohydrolase family protein [Bacillota bacterium]